MGRPAHHVRDRARAPSGAISMDAFTNIPTAGKIAMKFGVSETATMAKTRRTISPTG